MLKILTIGFLVLIGVYAVVLVQDLLRHKNELKQEKGNVFIIGAATAFIQFLATFGISDFSISIPIYRAAKWVDDKRMPGTLLTAAVIPGAIISILYISGGLVAISTLLCCIIAQSLGAVIGGRIVSNMNGAAVKRTMAIALLLSTFVLVAKLLFGNASGGSLYGFSTGTLLWLTPVYFVFGIINAMGFGVKAISMALLLTLGLSADCVLPVVLSSCGVGCCCGAVQYVKSGYYQRKIALTSSIAGTIGVFIGASFVTALSTDVLQWIMMVIMLYTAITMLLPEKAKK